MLLTISLLFDILVAILAYSQLGESGLVAYILGYILALQTHGRFCEKK
jgi:hypothetical protein